MAYTKDFTSEDIQKGSQLRMEYNDEYEHYAVGEFCPNSGWQIHVEGKNLWHTDGILLYMPFDKFPGGFELYVED